MGAGNKSETAAAADMPPKWPRRWKWTVSILAVMLLAGAAAWMNRTTLAIWGFDTLLAGHVKHKLEEAYVPLERAEREPEPAAAAAYTKHEPFTLLLLGTDQRDKEPARSDTMILSVVRPNDGRILMISIPRDAYVEVPDPDNERSNDHTKITHAFAYGGADLAVATVEELFGLHVDHYAMINFKGFRDVIDAMGGIPLPVEKDLVNDDPDHEKFVVKAGQPVYDGADALNFVRFREDGGDEVRTGRHQQFVDALLNKAAEPGQWSKLPELIGIMGDNFTTDIAPQAMIDLAKNLFAADTRSVVSHTLAGEGRLEHKGGAWYYYIDEDDLADAKAAIGEWLDSGRDASLLPDPGGDSAGAAHAALPAESPDAGSDSMRP